MYVCWGAHLDTYRDIWVRRVIIIIIIIIISRRCLWISVVFPVIVSVTSSCYVSVLVPVMTYGTRVMDPWQLLLCILGLTIVDLHLWFYTLGYTVAWDKVYRWGFPCLDYSFDVLVSCDRDLSVYNQSCLYSALLGISYFIMLYSPLCTIHVF